MEIQGTDSSTGRRSIRPPVPLPPRGWLITRWLPSGLVSRGARLTLVLVLLGSIIFTADTLRQNVAERAASPHLYSLVQWEMANFLDKWLHRASSIFPWNSLSETDRAETVNDYFALTAARMGISEELTDAVAAGAGEAELADLEAQLAALDRSRERMRADVEETLEGVISAIIIAEDISSLGGLIFPPVDFQLTRPPYVLVTSPRDRIERGDEALLTPNISLSDSLAIEDGLLAQRNLSALVIPIGGVATYPASIFNNRGLRWTLQIAAHEWLHHYLFFRPLGFNIFSSGDMQSLNETVADIAGREIGDRAFIALGGVIDDPVPPADAELDVGDERDADGFDFNAEMRETRLRAEELLSQGNTGEAEAYMEERRLIFVANGYNIRKLNQAYFAFHGTYADSPASVSPIGDQVREYRELSTDLGSFLGRVSSAGSYEGFVADLDALKAGAGK